MTPSDGDRQVSGSRSPAAGRSLPRPPGALVSIPNSAIFLDSLPSVEEKEEAEREVAVTVPPTQEGAHQAHLTLRGRDGTSQLQTIAWEVSPRIRVTPPGLILKPGSGPSTQSIIVRAKDRPFRVVSAKGPSLAKCNLVLPTEAALLHRLDFVLVPPGSQPEGASDIQIETDDPDQPLVVLSVLVQRGTEGGAL